MNFKEWMNKVDAEIIKRCGLSSDDLSDFPYHDMYDDGVSPAEVAEDVLEGEGF